MMTEVPSARIVVVLLLLTAGTTRGFSQMYSGNGRLRAYTAQRQRAIAPHYHLSVFLPPKLLFSSRGGSISHTSSTSLRGSAEKCAADWAEACDDNGIAASSMPLASADLTALLGAAMSGEPKRTDTFAEVGGGRGEAMAAACALFDWGQAALFLPETLQEEATALFEQAKDRNTIFEPCQIILGNPVDLKAGSRMLVYFDVLFADTRSSDWGLGDDGDATTMSAAVGQNALEGSRVVTVGRKLVAEEGVWTYALLHTLPLSCGVDGYVWEVTRSAKSTTPDRALAPEGGYVKGGWIKLVGLQKVPVLNGAIAVILEVLEDDVLSVMIDETCDVIKVRTKNAQPTTVIDP